MQQKHSKREAYSDTGIPQETRKISNNLTYHQKRLEKEEQTEPQVRRRKEIIKIRKKINKIETHPQKKKARKKGRKEERKKERIIETKSWFCEKINKIDEPFSQPH